MEKRQVGATTEYRHYIYGGTGPAAIARRVSTGANATYYLTTDHLGSTDVITDSAGAVLLRASFDAFGNRRGANWSGPPSSSDYEQIANTTRRGFTFHEHLDNLSMIHMNGRVYDSASGRFTSADPFVQAPYFSQSLNRYSYTFNNPLSYTDPSGFSATERDARPAGFDVDDIGDFLGDIYSGWFSWREAYHGNGACAFDLSTEKAWRSCIGLSWPMEAIEEAEPGAQTRNVADPHVSTVGGMGYSVTWEPLPEEPLRGGFSDLSRQIAEVLNGDCGKTVTCLTFPMWGTPRGGAFPVGSLAARSVGGLDDLAAFRSQLGLQAGEGALARLDIGGRSFYGINAHGQQVNLRVNAITHTHAEADAFQQAANASMRGGSATLYVRSCAVCCVRYQWWRRRASKAAWYW